MHQRKFIPAGILILILAISLFLSACNASGTEADASDDFLSGLGLEEMTDVSALDLRDKELTVQQYRLLRNRFPDCEILWNVPFRGTCYPSDIRDLSIDSLDEADLGFLHLFPNLESIQIQRSADCTVLAQLSADRPELRLDYNISFCGASVNCGATSLTISGEKLEEAASLLPYFRNLKSVTFAEPLPEAAQIYALQKEYPHVDFSWTLTFHNMTLDHTTAALDLTGIPVTVEEMETLIPYLPNLSYVDMSGCGIDNEQMDALNRRHKNIKIVWTVSIGQFIQLKTDTTWFMAAKFGYTVSTEDVYNLRYCTDIIAIDLGHMKITNCDFVAFMPHLRYLILADTKVKDLTPLTGLDELAFLELFLMDVQDFAPLETLTALEDLNLHYTQGNAEVISRMTWLKNLWWNRCSDQDLELLRQSIPGCHINYTSYQSTGGGWRNLPNYYAQRDIFGMPYMTD